MIRKITADRSSFKTLEFRPGLNILIADKHEGATDKDSRNGAGKTSFVELVHFLFGARASGRSIFCSDVLRDWRFEVELERDGERATAARSGSRPNSVEVYGAFAPERSRQPVLLSDNRPAPIKLDDWKDFLGKRWFGLEAPTEGSDPFRPGFRSLFSYFTRREGSGGFQDPMQHSKEQQTWDRQVSISWLLGLDWTVAQRFQRLRKVEKGWRALKVAVQSGELAQLARGAAELRTALTVSRAKARKKKERLGRFQVLPDYEDLEKEADEITGRINDLAGANLSDHALLRELETSLRDEGDPGQADIRKVFEEAEIVLPGLVHRRFDDVDRFHRKVLENRRAHLSAEIESARKRIADRERQKTAEDQRRRQIMRVLDSGGALAEYTALREEAGRLEAEAEGLSDRLADVERLESRQTEIKAERARLTKALQDDIRERDDRVKEAILRFEELSQSLYERAGSLTIGAEDGGPKFEVTIPSGLSKGIKNMQIFCFDLMLMELVAERGPSHGFLIHDSHLFDGVDERQVARALQFGARRAEAGGFQYIVTLNSDAIPQEGFAPGFAVKDYFMDVKLTDAGETGGLFGVHFDWPSSTNGSLPATPDSGGPSLFGPT